MTSHTTLPNVVMLAYDYPPNDGGISRLGAGLTSGLKRRGTLVNVITLRRTSGTGTTRPDVPHYEVNACKGLRELRTWVRLLQIDRSNPVIATVWNPEATVAVAAGCKRLTVLAHGNELMPYPYNGIKSRLRRYVLSRAHRVVCNSSFTEGLVRNICPKAATLVINPAVDVARFRLVKSRTVAREMLELPQDCQILISVARLDPNKGHDTVLRAMSRLSEESRSKFLYLIVGKGQNNAPLKALAQKLGIFQQVRFLGFVPDDTLPLYYAASDLFVLCSYLDGMRRSMEGFGMAFTEAQAAGLPVIGTRSGGIPDAVQEGTGGWLIDEHDDAALARLLKQLLLVPEVFSWQGELGRVRVESQMSWKSYVDRLLDVL